MPPTLMKKVIKHTSIVFYFAKKKALFEAIRYLIKNYSKNINFVDVEISNNEEVLRGFISAQSINEFLGYDFRLSNRIWKEFKPSITTKFLGIALWKSRQGKLYHKDDIKKCFKYSFHDTY